VNQGQSLGCRVWLQVVGQNRPPASDISALSDVIVYSSTGQPGRDEKTRLALVAKLTCVAHCSVVKEPRQSAPRPRRYAAGEARRNCTPAPSTRQDGSTVLVHGTRDSLRTPIPRSPCDPKTGSALISGHSAQAAYIPAMAINRINVRDRTAWSLRCAP
jgi:hypothetical protein